MINIVCPFFGSSGYCSHSRGLFNALAKQTEVKLSTHLPPGWEKDVNDRELEAIKKPDTEDSINLIIDLPHNWRMHTKDGRNWAYVIWEGDKVPVSWIDEFLNPDIEYIFVPSEHTKKAILNTIRDYSNITTENLKDINNLIDNKIKIVPHGVDLNKFYPKETKRDKFRFLCNKGFRNLEDRGGIQYAIQAYLEEFTTENVELALKINPAYPIGNIQDVLTKFGANNESPLISINTENTPYDKLVDSYNVCDVFVAPSRSDAFNLTCIEAMACSKPVITTNFGGQTDFCNGENSWIISGELSEIDRSIEDYAYESVKWLTPSIPELRKAMRHAYEHPKLIKEKSEEAIKTARQFTWEKNSKKIIELI